MALSKWTVDPVHSSVEFSIRHMMISRVKGSFDRFSAEIEADPHDLTTAKITFNVDVASINTANEDRDNHLRSADFFDVENYPNMTFKATKITRKSEGVYDVTGDLTIRGTTRPETFTATFEGVAKDPMGGGEKAGFNIEGEINRSEYGLTWNAPMETGGVLVSDEVKISIDLQAALED